MCLLDKHQIGRWTIPKLKPCLVSRNLSEGGKKASMVARLQTWRAADPLVYDEALAGMAASTTDLTAIIPTGTKVDFAQAGQFLSWV